MFEQFKAIILENLSIDEELITLDADLKKDLGINSLDLADLILACEEKFDVEIDDTKLSSFITVGDVVDYLSSL